MHAERAFAASAYACGATTHPGREIAPVQDETVADYAFGHFVLNGRRRELWAKSQVVALGGRALDVLLVLVANAGALVTKDELMELVWPDVTVEENNLQVQISTLRRTLGPDRGWIVTAAGRGYRFVAQVSRPPARADGTPAGAASTGLIQAHPMHAEAVRTTATQPSQFSLLVLPFASRGPDQAQSWFANGVTDSLTTDFARVLPGSTVIAQSTAETYRGRPFDAREIGRSHCVRYVLDGSILLADRQVRVNAQLIDTETGRHLWAERFDMAWQDTLPLQDAIADRLLRKAGQQIICAELRRDSITRAGDPRPERRGRGGDGAPTVWQQGWAPSLQAPLAPPARSLSGGEG